MRKRMNGFAKKKAIVRPIVKAIVSQMLFAFIFIATEATQNARTATTKICKPNFLIGIVFPQMGQ